ncbi:MAG TPA: TlpA disulfide reductase family protein [Gemmatimonadales bacterium]|nr:TlpA disulfide reductase family protein [Gemmatimonadales bacterium]
MKRQGLWIASIVAGFILLGWGLATFAPPPDGVTIGRTAPDYRAVSLATGDTVSLRDAYRGQVTLLNVWATWCAPCRAEMPSMERTYQVFKDRGFRIAAVSVDVGESDKVRAFQQEFGLTFDILHDASGLIQQRYQMIGVPQSFLLDRRGIVRFVSLGEEHWDSDTNRARIEALLAD